MGFPNNRVRLTRILALLFFGVIAVFCVARFAVPAIYDDPTKMRSRFTAGTALPGAPARPGLHFGSTIAPYGEETHYIYVRLGSQVWVYERITTSQQ
jgi:hypothetical protein